MTLSRLSASLGLQKYIRVRTLNPHLVHPSPLLARVLAVVWSDRMSLSMSMSLLSPARWLVKRIDEPRRGLCACACYLVRYKLGKQKCKDTAANRNKIPTGKQKKLNGERGYLGRSRRAPCYAKLSMRVFFFWFWFSLRAHDACLSPETV